KLAVARWPLAEDREQFDRGLRQAIHSLRTGDFEALGLDLASPSWRTWLWDTHRGAILDALTRAPKSMPFKIPAAKQGMDPPLVLLSGPELSGREADVLPFTSEAFGRLTELAPTSGYKWSELHATAVAWWSRAFPRGLLREADTGMLIEIRT